MTPEEIIKNKVKKFIQSGGILVRDRWGICKSKNIFESDDNNACALGAVLIGTKRDKQGWYLTQYIMRELNVNLEWIASFMAGYEGHKFKSIVHWNKNGFLNPELKNSRSIKEAWILGRKIWNLYGKNKIIMIKLLLYIDRRGKMVCLEASGTMAELDEYSPEGFEDQCLAWDDVLDSPPKEQLPGFFVFEGTTKEAYSHGESYFSEGYDYCGKMRPAEKFEILNAIEGKRNWQGFTEFTNDELKKELEKCLKYQNEPGFISRASDNIYLEKL